MIQKGLIWYRLCRPIVQLVNFFLNGATPHHLQKSNAVNFSFLLKDKSGENMRYLRKLCSFSYLISSFFNRSTIGSLAGMLIFLSSYLPYIVVIAMNHTPEFYQQFLMVSTKLISLGKIILY